MGLIGKLKRLLGFGAKGVEYGGKSTFTIGRFATNKKSMGFLVIVLSFFKSILKSSSEAWQQKSPIPIIKQVGGEIFTTDKVIVENVQKLKEGVDGGIIDTTIVYADLYTALFTMFVLFVVFYLLSRGLFVGSGNPFFNSMLLAFALMFLVEGFYYLISIVFWDMPTEEFVWPLKGLWVFFKNYSITIPG